MQKIRPFLWFDDQAEEAMAFYTSIFENSKVGGVRRGPDGSVLTASFELDGLQITALNGGPQYQFTEAMSLYVDCTSQEEVDRLWERLADGGEILMCGWLKDRFGVTWQIIPSALPRLLTDPDREKANRVMQAMLEMKKIDVAGLERAAAG